MPTTQYRGAVRVIDRLGRVVVPMEIRKANGWQAQDEIEFVTDGDSVTLRSPQKDQRQLQAVEKLKLVLETTNDEDVKKQIQEAIHLVEGDLNWNYQ